jgi:hypothetical protein
MLYLKSKHQTTLIRFLNVYKKQISEHKTFAYRPNGG